jgi:glutathione synthase
VTSDRARLLDFARAQPEGAVVKPLDRNGGAEVFHLRQGDRNLHALIEAAVEQGARFILAQRYLPEVRQGDKRILLLDGEPLGAVLRVPADDEARANLHVGARPVRCGLTDRDREICARLAPRLRADGQHFVGIDVIGPWLTEVNVTSPTGVREVNALEGARLQERIVDWIEKRAS